MRKLGHAYRTLAAAPAFTAVVLFTLALAIGASSAVFSVVDAVLLRPLRYPDASELVLVRNRVADRSVPLSVIELEELRAEPGLFRGASGSNPIPANVTGAEGDERVHALATTTNYFDVLGSKPSLGRTFAKDDALDGYGEVAVISNAYFKRRFGGDARVLGTKIRLDEDDYVIVGVMGPEFQHPSEPAAVAIDIYLPCGFRQSSMSTEEQGQRGRRMLTVIGRLAPGVTVSAAQQRLDALAARLRSEHPTVDGPKSGAAVRPLAEEVVASARRTLGILMAAVTAVLLMACANVASLLLARGDGRRRDIAIRAALGATRGRIAMEVLVESLVLSLSAGALGLLVALWGTELLVALAPRGIPRTDEVQVNARVLLFTLLVSIGTGVLFGLVPALQATRVEPQEVMKEGSRATFGKRRVAVLRLLVTAELAVSVVLLATTGILVREVRGTLSLDPGFEPAGLSFARMWVSVPNDPSRSPYEDPAKRADLAERLRASFASIPGVHGVAVSSHVPIVDGGHRPKEACVPQGVPLDDAAREPELWQHVDAGYFGLMGVRILAGRTFGGAQATGGPTALVVSEGFSRRWFGSPEAAVGKTVLCHTWDDHKVAAWRPHAITGVVADVRLAGLGHPPSASVYFPMSQVSDYGFAFLARHAGASRVALEAAMKARARAIEPAYPLVEVGDVEDELASTLAPRRFVATVLAFFAVVAFALATMGTYGAASFAVGQRREEIGLRVALGASERHIVELVLAQTVLQSVPGAALGLLITVAVHGARAADPATLCGVVLLLAGAAVLAGWYPAARASRATPILTLRRE